MKKYIKENLTKKMITILFMALVIMCFFILTAFAQGEKNEEKSELENEFRKVDVVNDGKIDQGEFDIYHRDIFLELDSDKDHLITKEECVSNCFTDKTKAKKMDSVKYEFNNIDIDGSGVVQLYELILHGREKFRTHDINGDNFIDKNEFCTFYQATMPCSFVIAKEGEL